jgi:DNA primase
MGQSGLHSELKAWVTHPNFRAAVEEFQSKLRSGERVTKENAVFYNHITRTIERYRDVALEQVKREFPELQSQIIEKKLIKAEQRRPTQETKPIDFEYLVNMPIK